MCNKTVFENGKIETLIESGGIIDEIYKHRNNPFILREIKAKVNDVKQERIRKNSCENYIDDVITTSITIIERWKRIYVKKERMSKRRKAKKIVKDKKAFGVAKLQTRFSHS